MVYKLVDLQSGSFLTENSEPQNLGGDWGNGIASGRLKWLAVPEGERADEVIFNGLKLVVDPAKKATREANEQTRAQRIARMRQANVDGITTLAQAKPIIKDLLDELKERF